VRYTREDAVFIKVSELWSTKFSKDIENVVKRCIQCQYFAKIDKIPSNYLSGIQGVLPFDKWGTDLLRPFPPAKGQRKFIIVAIDYFSICRSRSIELYHG
jgi:hypothetical protein